MGTGADVLGRGEGKHRAIAHLKGGLEADHAYRGCTRRKHGSEITLSPRHKRLLALLNMVDADFDARVALEREHRTEGRRVVGAIEEADAERGGGRGEGPRGSRSNCQAVADLAKIASSPSEPRSHRIWIPW